MISPLLFIVLALATYRITRFFVHDSLIGANLDSGSRFSQWLDSFCFHSLKDGLRLNGTDRSWTRGKVHDLLTCPYCLGWWIALAVTCLGLSHAPWSLGVQGWLTVWAVAAAAAIVYQIDLALLRS